MTQLDTVTPTSCGTPTYNNSTCRPYSPRPGSIECKLLAAVYTTTPLYAIQRCTTHHSTVSNRARGPWPVDSPHDFTHKCYRLLTLSLVTANSTASPLNSNGSPLLCCANMQHSNFLEQVLYYNMYVCTRKSNTYFMPNALSGPAIRDTLQARTSLNANTR